MELDDTTFDELPELTPEEQEAMEAAEKQAAQDREDTLLDLAMQIEGKLQKRIQNRSAKEREWIQSTRLYLGNLSGRGDVTNPDKPFANNIMRNRPEVNIVSAKCDIAIAKCVSMQFATGEKNWDLWPSANETTTENASKAALMSKEIETQLDKCGYGYQSRLAITDRIVMGSGILKGPVNTGKICKEYAPMDGDPNMWVPTVTVSYYPDVSRVNPWFFYPDDTTNDFSKCQDTIEVHPMSDQELAKLRKHDGFEGDVITKILKEGRSKDFVNPNFVEYSKLTDGDNPYLFKDKRCVIEYHGPISKTELDKLEIEPSYDSPTDEYYGEVWVVEGKIIRIELENIEASFEVPYAMSTMKKDPSSVFGFGMPLTMKDAQRVVSQTWHMILDNGSLSSGPQVAIQKRYIQPADQTWEIAPCKAWNLTDPMMKVQDAIQFFNVPNVTESLLPILQLAREFAQEESNTPLDSAGLGSADNVESATGQLITKQNSTVLLDFLAEDWDDCVTQKVISRMYGWNMQFNPKPEIKGNYIIDVRSSTEFKNKQIHVRDLERLSMEVAQNPEMAKQVKMDELTRMRLEMMNLPNRTVIRTPEEVAQWEQAMSQQPNPDAMDAQLKQMELELKKEELKMKKLELAFQIKQQQQREQWEHEEKMSANYARTVESQAMVLRSQNDKETQLIKLAATSEDAQRKDAILAGIAQENNDTKLFMKSMEETRKVRENLLTERELDIKEKQGSGI